MNKKNITARNYINYLIFFSKCFFLEMAISDQDESVLDRLFPKSRKICVYDEKNENLASSDSRTIIELPVFVRDIDEEVETFVPEIGGVAILRNCSLKNNRLKFLLQR